MYAHYLTMNYLNIMLLYPPRANLCIIKWSEVTYIWGAPMPSDGDSSLSYIHTYSLSGNDIPYSCENYDA